MSSTDRWERMVVKAIGDLTDHVNGPITDEFGRVAEAFDKLGDVVDAQAARIDALEARIELLERREATAAGEVANAFLAAAARTGRHKEETP